MRVVEVFVRPIDGRPHLHIECEGGMRKMVLLQIGDATKLASDLIAAGNWLLQPPAPPVESPPSTPEAA